MSVDFVFWKDLVPNRPTPAELGRIYASLNRREPVPTVVALPVEDILNRLIETFPDFEPAAQFPMIELPDGALEVSWGDQHFRFDCRGDTDAAMGSVVAIMREFGCPVYAPNVNQRYPLEGPDWLQTPPIEPSPQADVTRAKVASATPAQEFADRDEAEYQRRLAELATTDPESYRNLLRFRENVPEQSPEELEWEARVQHTANLIVRQSPEGRWRRLGLNASTVAAWVINFSKVTATPQVASPESFIDHHSVYRDLVHKSFGLVCISFLQALPADHVTANWRSFARSVAPQILEFFDGAWRDGYKEWAHSPPMTRAQTRQQLGWIDPYREGLLVALAADDDSLIARITAWPDTDLPVDEGSLNLTSADNQCHIWLARRLRGELGAETDAMAERIRQSKRPRAIKLLTTAESLFAGKIDGFKKGLSAIVANFAKSGFRETRPDAMLSIEASVLWHVARRRRPLAPPIDLKPGQMDLILH